MRATSFGAFGGREKPALAVFEICHTIQAICRFGRNAIDIVADVGIDIYGPAGMTAELVNRLNMQIGDAVKSAEFRSRLDGYNMVAAFSTPEELATLAAAERKMWEGPIKDSGYNGD